MNDSCYPLKKQHDKMSCLYWNLLIAVPLVTACTAIGRHSVMALLLYILLTILVFAGVVFRFFCTRCPHYVQSEGTVKCLFIWGAPKLFKERQGPYTLSDMALIGTAIGVWALMPLYWLIHQLGLLLIYLLSLAAFGATLKRYECPRCTHFECPVNAVPDSVRNSQEPPEPQA